ncbi:hypothetical protein PGTUg99_026447 [Puccinia graminis f. sp. tritici]|uniref:Uncharacterized protein n=1 Tax=Puccinia graminis f. sp. tritici TaxID=56615 RepID=A0A5B0Q4I2_PUCGR|nr:hypothetical protein PGTUg99_026447 [Puccinia graminis f. sp. tritici]
MFSGLIRGSVGGQKLKPGGQSSPPVARSRVRWRCSKASDSEDYTRFACMRTTQGGEQHHTSREHIRHARLEDNGLSLYIATSLRKKK